MGPSIDSRSWSESKIRGGYTASTNVTARLATNGLRPRSRMLLAKQDTEISQFRDIHATETIYNIINVTLKQDGRQFMTK